LNEQLPSLIFSLNLHSSFIQSLPVANIIFISLSQIESLDANEDPILLLRHELAPLIEATGAFHNG